MQNTTTITPNRQETPHRPLGFAVVLMPVFWVVAWIMGSRAPEKSGGVEPSIPSIADNRKLRRAKVSCLRRAKRFAAKWQRPVDPRNYMPEAYAHCAYVQAMPKHWSYARFLKNYARDSGLGRTRVFGLSSAHYITTARETASQTLSEILAALCGTAWLSSSALRDPDPP